MRVVYFDKKGNRYGPVEIKSIKKIPMAKDKIYIESMTKIKFGALVIRCWQKEKNKDYSETINRVRIKKVIQNFLAQKKSAVHYTLVKYELAEFILKTIEPMNAVEVLHKDDENGCVLYKNWP